MKVIYCLNEGRAVNLGTDKVFKDRIVLKEFNRLCTCDNVVLAKCEVDRDSNNIYKEGITSYSVQTKDSNVMVIEIHENNYGYYKEQMAVLNNSINNAREKIRNRRANKKFNGMLIVGSAALTVLAGSYFIEKTKGYESVNSKPPIEIQTEASTDTYLVDEQDSEKTIKSIDSFNQKENERQRQELEQYRQELNSSSVITSPEEIEQPKETTNSYPTGNFVSDPEKTIESIDLFNQKENERQKQELEQYRDELNNSSVITSPEELEYQKFENQELGRYNDNLDSNSTKTYYKGN